MRRKIGVVVFIGVFLLLLAVWGVNRTKPDRQLATDAKPSSASQPLSEQKGIAVAQAQAPSAEVSAWAMLLQVMPRLEDTVAPNSLGATFRDLTLVDFAVSALEIENSKKRSPAADRLSEALRALKAQVAAFRVAQDDSDMAPPRTVTLGDIRATCEQLQKFYESAVLAQARALAQRYRCP